MPRRGENIFKRKDGRWEARYIIDREGGRAVYRSIYASTYTEAKKKRMRTMMAEGIAPRRRQGTELECLSELWLSDVRRRVKESTYTRYHRIVTKYLQPSLGQVPPDRLDVVAVEHYVDELMEGGGLRGEPLSPKSVQDIVSVLRSILRFGRTRGYGCADLKELRLPGRKSRPIRVMSEGDRERLEKLLLEQKEPICLGILFSVFLGLRIGEVCGLRWGDIHFESGTVQICRTVERIPDLGRNSAAKTKVVISSPKTEHANRLIPVPRTLLAHLARFRRQADCYIITGSEAYLEPHALYLSYKRYLRRLQIDDNTYHALRHTFATRCVEAGFNPKTLSEILGHASVTTTMSIYVHPSLESKRRELERLYAE